MSILSLESAKWVFLEGFAPQMTLPELEALRRGLETNDPRLCQSMTTNPLHSPRIGPETIRQACAVTYAGWQGGTVFDTEDATGRFAELCYGADKLLGEPSSCRHFLNWFDDTSRDQMRPELLSWVEESIRRRAQPVQPATDIPTDPPF